MQNRLKTLLAFTLGATLVGCGGESEESAKPQAAVEQVQKGAEVTQDAPVQASVKPVVEDKAAHHKVKAEPWDSTVLANTLNALPSGDIQRGEKAHNELLCISCHAVTGQPNSRNFVNLNHQPANYVKKVLIDYRDERRAEPYGQSKIMTYIAKTLTDQQIADLAVFYASQPLPKGKDAGYLADEATLKIVNQGDMRRMVMSCAACHGAQGQGNGDQFPALAGQEIDYTVRTLTAYRSGDRKNDVNGMMGNIAKNLTDEEILGLAKFYANINP